MHSLFSNGKKLKEYFLYCRSSKLSLETIETSYKKGGAVLLPPFYLLLFKIVLIQIILQLLI